MTESTIEGQAVVDALEDLFAREQEGLLAGDLEAVMRLAVWRESLLGQVRAIRVSQPVLERLRIKAARNAGLLAAAAQGVRAANLRVRGLIEGPAPLSTYDARGRRHMLGDRDGDTATIRRL